MALGTTNISIDLVKQTIEESYNDVGMLCKGESINKWAKYKPFSWPNELFVNLMTGTNYRGPELTYGHAGYYLPTGRWCGLRPFVRYCTYPADIASVYDTDDALDKPMNGWEFLKPTGGAASPYRSGDFRSYEHSRVHAVADCPFHNWFTNSQSFYVGERGEFVANYHTSEYTYGIGPNDFTALNNMYFGVLVKVFNGSTTTYYLKTSNKMWLAQDPGDTIDVNGISQYFAADRAHDFYPVLSTVGNYSGQATLANALLVSFPNYKKITKMVWSSVYRFELQCYYQNGNPNKIKMYLICYSSNGQNSITLTNIKIYYDSINGDPGSTFSYEEYANDNVDYSNYAAVKMTYSANIMRQTRTVRAQGSALNEKDIMYLSTGGGEDEYTFRQVKDASANTMYGHIEFDNPAGGNKITLYAEVIRESN